MKSGPDIARGLWMTLPIYSTKLHFFVPGTHREAARPSLCPQFYSSSASKAVRNPAERDKCKTCRDRLARLTEAKSTDGAKAEGLSAGGEQGIAAGDGTPPPTPTKGR